MPVSFQIDIKPLFDFTSRSAMMDGCIYNADNANHKPPIKPIFVHDIEGGPFDLHNYEHVKARADRIKAELIDRAKALSPGEMPTGMPLPTSHLPPWTQGNIDLFVQWIADGRQP